MSDGRAYSGRELHPYEVAYLTGGTRHTIAASLAALRAEGVFAASMRGRLRVTGTPTTVRTPIDLALFDAVQRGRMTIHGLLVDRGVRQAIEDLRRPLNAEGLAAATKGSFRRWAKPSTKAGQEVLRQLRDHHSHLHPRYAPAWDTYGPMGVAMGVGLFGPVALRSIDPAFAVTVGWHHSLTRSSRRSSSSSGGGSGYYGGCGSGGDSGDSGGGGGGGGCGGGGS